MLECTDRDGLISIETDRLKAAIQTKKYLTGLKGGALVDKETGAVDPCYGLHMMDWLMAPGWRDDCRTYVRNRMVHGDIPKHIIEGPQLATDLPSIPYEIIRGPGFIAVREWFVFTDAGTGYKAGSRWEQTMLFLPDTRYVLTCEVIRNVNTVGNLFYRIDMPGHIKHKRGDVFRQVHLSYHGTIAAAEFLTDFPPEKKFYYVRDDRAIPERFIRSYQLTLPGGGAGPWLAGMTLDPAAPCEAWCHQRGYVCFIQELHGRPVVEGQVIGAAYVMGYFDSIGDMHETYDRLRGARTIEIGPSGCRLRDELPA